MIVRGLQLSRGAPVGDVVAAWMILHFLEGQEVLHSRVGPGQVHLALGGRARAVAQLVEILNAVGLPIQIETYVLRADVDRVA